MEQKQKKAIGCGVAEQGPEVDGWDGSIGSAERGDTWRQQQIASRYQPPA